MLLLLTPAVLAHPGVDTRIARIDQAIQQTPEDWHLYLKRCVLHIHAGHLEKAAADLDTAEALGAGTRAAFHRGQLAHAKGDFPAAIEYFSQAPESAATLLNRARAYRQAGQLERASLDYRRHLALDERPQPGDVIAAVEVLDRLEGPQAAERLLSRHLHSPNAQLQRLHIDLLLRSQRTDAALEAGR